MVKFEGRIRLEFFLLLSLLGCFVFLFIDSYILFGISCMWRNSRKLTFEMRKVSSVHPVSRFLHHWLLCTQDTYHGMERANKLRECLSRESSSPVNSWKDDVVRFLGRFNMRRLISKKKSWSVEKDNWSKPFFRLVVFAQCIKKFIVLNFFLVSWELVLWRKCIYLLFF